MSALKNLLELKDKKGNFVWQPGKEKCLGCGKDSDECIIHDLTHLAHGPNFTRCLLCSDCMDSSMRIK